ncbi:MAG: hypothetical protein JNK05_03450 [Myxococcales bacterium]|nr:hypothetical protein [Myxococcales bacterium]
MNKLFAFGAVALLAASCKRDTSSRDRSAEAPAPTTVATTLPPIAPVSAEAAQAAVAASYALQSGPWGSMYIPALWQPIESLQSPPVLGATLTAAFGHLVTPSRRSSLQAIYLYTSRRTSPTASGLSELSSARGPLGYSMREASAPGGDGFPGFDVGWRRVENSDALDARGGWLAAFARGDRVYWIVCYSMTFPSGTGAPLTSCDRALDTFRPPPGE